MSFSEIYRRDFSRLSLAAFGGLVAGTAARVALAQDAKATPKGKSAAKDETESTDTKSEGKSDDKKPARKTRKPAKKKEMHVCRGLNTCKGQGRSGENKCAGMGDCSTTATDHTCASENQCKGQGGCAVRVGKMGLNECANQGGGAVPLYFEDTPKNSPWHMARARFEARMKRAGREFGPAPPPKEEIEAKKYEEQRELERTAKEEARKKELEEQAAAEEEASGRSRRKPKEEETGKKKVKKPTKQPVKKPPADKKETKEEPEEEPTESETPRARRPRKKSDEKTEEKTAVR
jgi:hypothetical protein